MRIVSYPTNPTFILIVLLCLMCKEYCVASGLVEQHTFRDPVCTYPPPGD